MPPTVMNPVSMTTRNLCRSAAWTIRWIIQLSEFLARGFQACTLRLALQRVRKLQEQAAISDDLVASFQPAGNLRLSIQAFSKGHGASAKLVRRGRGINKRLVLGIAQDSSIREHNGMRDGARV